MKKRNVSEIYSVVFTDNRTLHVTGNHPVYVPAQKSWVPVEDLKVGDAVSYLKGKSLNTIVIFSLSKEEKEVDVYDLSIEAEKSFFAEGVWVHNY